MNKIAAILFFLILSAPIYAGGLSTIDFNYINDHFGDRATGLGGAYTAISDDPSGAFYNPAGINFAIDNQISLSVNNFKSKSITMEKTINQNDYNQQVESFYPSFFGVVQTLGKLKIAVSWLTFNNEILDQDEYYNNIIVTDESNTEYPGKFIMNYNITDNTFMGGITISTFLTDSLAVGFTFFGFKRRKEEILNQLVLFEKSETSETTYELINQYITEEIYGLNLNFGVQYMPSKRIAVGLSVMKGIILSHDAEVQLFSKREAGSSDLGGIDSEGNPLYTSRKLSGDLTSSSDMPWAIRGGVAYFHSQTLLFTFDVIAHLGNKYYQNTVEHTINFAFGSEIYITPSFPVRAGIFTNFANTPKIDKNKANQQMHTDLYGASISISWETKNSSITVGGFIQTNLYAGTSQIFEDLTATQKTNISYYSIALTGSAKY